MRLQLIVTFAVLAALAGFVAPAGTDAKATPTCHGKKATQWLTAPGTLAFTANNDVLVGSSDDDTLNSGTYGGTDLVCANGGDDTIEIAGGGSISFGGAGSDSVTAYYTYNVFDCGPNNDTLTLTGCNPASITRCEITAVPYRRQSGEPV